MSDNDFSGSDAIRKAKEQGLVFSEDKKTLKKIKGCYIIAVD